VRVLATFTPCFRYVAVDDKKIEGSDTAVDVGDADSDSADFDEEVSGYLRQPVEFS
jgi:hypothetical protein